MNVLLHQAARSGHLDTLKTLIEQGADINDRGPTKWSVLIAAAVGGHAETVGWLLEKQATRESLDPEEGKNALHYAAMLGHVDTVRLLLECGFAVNTPDRLAALTPLHLAASSAGKDNAVATLDLLLENAASIEARDKWGMTPLMRTCFRGRLEVMRFLLDRGANIDAHAKDGATTLIMAAGHLCVYEAVQVLLE